MPSRDDPTAAPARRFRTSPRFLVAVAGGVASGKSTTARRLAALLETGHVGSDEVRAELDPPGIDPFSDRLEALVYAELLRRADAELAAGRSVVVDGCFSLQSERAEIRAIAVRHRAPFLFVECRASEETIRERLAARDAKLEGDEPFWPDIHASVAARWEPSVEIAEDERAIVRTDAPVDEVLAAVVARIRERRDEAARPEAVTFDCWNTLLYDGDWPLAHEKRVTALREAAEAAGRPTSPEEATVAFDRAWARHMETWRLGEATGAREVAGWALAELGLVAADSPAAEELVRSFEEASHSKSVRALEGAREALETLDAAGIPCALVCDTGLTPGRVVREHLDRLGLLRHLRVQAFSDEVGVPKPDPRIFRAALDGLGVDPSRALHVGDLRRTDVAGARSLGMRSVRIRARHDDLDPLAEADYVVSSHAELVELLEIS